MPPLELIKRCCNLACCVVTRLGDLDLTATRGDACCFCRARAPSVSSTSCEFLFRTCKFLLGLAQVMPASVYCVGRKLAGLCDDAQRVTNDGLRVESESANSVSELVESGRIGVHAD